MDRVVTEILRKLHKEKSQGANDKVVSGLVALLVQLGVYPISGVGKYTPLEMVYSWGVDWHQFDGPHYCPMCGADLRNWDTGPPIKREIHVKVLNSNEFSYKCPDCMEDISDAVIAARPSNSRHCLKDVEDSGSDLTEQFNSAGWWNENQLVKAMGEGDAEWVVKKMAKKMVK